MSNSDIHERLSNFCFALVDQDKARVVIEPQERATGFWFGGGNMVEGPDGGFYVVGRYRNAGDSRTGVAAGTRGLEMAIFRSVDFGQSFQKVVSWDKAALNSPTGDVLSIEGCCLRFTHDGVELFVSTEKTGVPYPECVRDFLKPGAGVWTIDVLKARTINDLVLAEVVPAFSSACPEHLHVKDPFFWATSGADGSGPDRLGYCSHPFGWSSSNTGVADIPADRQLVTNPQHSVFPRGTTWDVAMTRGTSVLPLPKIGPFAEQHHLLFYCGGECLREMDEHSTAVKRPRGYSCEEIGGAAYFADNDIANAKRLSNLQPMFISPYGTGCSRYVDVMHTTEGYYATWQQSQNDLSQPLVINFLAEEVANEILAG